MDLVSLVLLVILLVALIAMAVRTEENRMDMISLVLLVLLLVDKDRGGPVSVTLVSMTLDSVAIWTQEDRMDMISLVLLVLLELVSLLSPPLPPLELVSLPPLEFPAPHRSTFRPLLAQSEAAKTKKESYYLVARSLMEDDVQEVEEVEEVNAWLTTASHLQEIRDFVPPQVYLWNLEVT